MAPPDTIMVFAEHYTLIGHHPPPHGVRGKMEQEDTRGHKKAWALARRVV